MKAVRLLISVLVIFIIALDAKEASALVAGETPFTCSGSEALACARQLCPTCKLEGSTSLYQ